ncbi:MAG: substrate-binding domain-containing protein [Lachnospiraceae bacterium]|nr:substrate-binding domain-containing protein [Lachnospiraceae bacterium]
MLISTDRSDLWNTVFEAAGECANEHDAVLDWIGTDAPVAYTIRDCMNIAVSSGVDGIILHREAVDDLTDLIDEAADKGIPVITVLNDDSESRRISFVGMNSYQMGEIYAQQVLESLHEGTNRVMLLTSLFNDNSSLNLLYSQMLQVIENGKEDNQEVILTAHVLNTATSFDAEEGIRDIFIRGEALPDTIVCMDLTATECVSQALVDYNKVGSVTVIGYYASETVLDAISKGLIRSTLGIDAREIGKVCIEALDEYWTLGRVSNYFNIGLSMITADDVRKGAIQDDGMESAPEGPSEVAG